MSTQFIRFLSLYLVSRQLNWLALRRASHLYFVLLNAAPPAAEFRHPSTRRRHHHHHLDGGRSTIVRFMCNFLLHTIKLWIDLPSGVLPINYHKKVFKKTLFLSKRLARNFWILFRLVRAWR
ncbi:hypothetical protein EVAR_13171_1 [Eumeta japonica]|uniref:Uncharacterized protein n=1 Tax=Eumeta variegata TaxID=151549 RepID=A0A4C1UA08_EUMVA|nr:hypothetical protein EVAR_13171_1 [Eumeta japonica]